MKLAGPVCGVLRDAYRSVGSAELFALISYAEGRTYMHDCYCGILIR